MQSEHILSVQDMKQKMYSPRTSEKTEMQVLDTTFRHVLSKPNSFHNMLDEKSAALLAIKT